MTVAHDLLDELRQHHVHIERHGDRLQMRAPARPPADLLARLKAHKPALLAALPDVDADTRHVLHFRLPEHPANAWASLVGRPGESRDAVLVSLLQRWPDAEVRHATR